MPRKSLIQYRRGSAAQWLDVDPVLADGEVGFASDANQIRVGDGVTKWSLLAPVGGIAGEGVGSIQRITQADYDLLNPPDPTTLYVIPLN
jgi:hypothetical protein